MFNFKKKKEKQVTNEFVTYLENTEGQYGVKVRELCNLIYPGGEKFIFNVDNHPLNSKVKDNSNLIDYVVVYEDDDCWQIVSYGFQYYDPYGEDEQYELSYSLRKSNDIESDKIKFAQIINLFFKLAANIVSENVKFSSNNYIANPCSDELVNYDGFILAPNRNLGGFLDSDNIVLGCYAIFTQIIGIDEVSLKVLSEGNITAFDYFYQVLEQDYINDDQVRIPKKDPQGLKPLHYQKIFDIVDVIESSPLKDDYFKYVDDETQQGNNLGHQFFIAYIYMASLYASDCLSASVFSSLLRYNTEFDALRDWMYVNGDDKIRWVISNLALCSTLKDYDFWLSVLYEELVTYTKENSLFDQPVSNLYSDDLMYHYADPEKTGFVMYDTDNLDYYHLFKQHQHDFSF